MLKYLLLFTAVLLSPAMAQPQQQASPSETALQMNSIIGTWAQTLVQQARAIEDLQRQLATAQQRVNELEPKRDTKK